LAEKHFDLALLLKKVIEDSTQKKKNLLTILLFAYEFYKACVNSHTTITCERMRSLEDEMTINKISFIQNMILPNNIYRKTKQEVYKKTILLLKREEFLRQEFLQSTYLRQIIDNVYPILLKQHFDRKSHGPLFAFPDEQQHCIDPYHRIINSFFGKIVFKLRRFRSDLYKMDFHTVRWGLKLAGYSTGVFEYQKNDSTIQFPHRYIICVKELRFPEKKMSPDEAIPLLVQNTCRIFGISDSIDEKDYRMYAYTERFEGSNIAQSYEYVPNQLDPDNIASIEMLFY
jgi:hypothetical protein